MNIYLKQIIHTQFFNILNIVFGFATLFILIKYLEIVEYGEYVLIQGFIAISGIVFSQNLYTYTRLHIPGAEMDAQYGYLKTVLSIIFSVYLVTIIIAKMFNFENFLWNFFEINHRIGYLILIMLAFELLNLELMRYFIAIKKIYLKNYAQFFQKAFLLFGSLILLYINHLTLQNFLYLFISGQLFVLMMFIRDIDIVKFLKSCFKYDVLERGYAVALPLLPIGLMSIALNYTDTLMISKFIDKAHTAQYGFASQIISIAMMMIGSSIVLTLFPYATHAHNDKDIKLRTEFFIKMYKFGIYSAIVFYLLVTVNAYFAIELLDLDQYNEVPKYLSILAIFPLFQLIYNVSSHHLQLMNIYKLQVIIAFFVMSENIVLNYFMIQNYGVMGAAFASLIAFITLSGFYLALAMKYDAELLKILKKSINSLLLLVIFILMSIGLLFYYFDLYQNRSIVLAFDVLSVMVIIVYLLKFRRLTTT